mmetsp:Transcript_23122/g.68724  ORF Transcript_23122/g.68724 Transcript_23122/m.68724 type:complete len:283 (-) Transcript_23122:1038-1886(-)
MERLARPPELALLLLRSQASNALWMASSGRTEARAGSVWHMASASVAAHPPDSSTAWAKTCAPRPVGIACEREDAIAASAAAATVAARICATAFHGMSCLEADVSLSSKALPGLACSTADSCSKARHSCPPTSRHPPSSASATCTARSTRPCARSTCAPPVAAPCGVPLPLVGGGIPLEGTGAVLVLVGVLSGEGDGERKGAPGPGSSRASAGSLQTESAVPYGAGGVANEAMLTSQRQVCAQMASNAAAAMHTPLHTAHALLRHSGLMATRNPDGSISSSA